jgi:hypothetical protein
MRAPLAPLVLVLVVACDDASTSADAAPGGGDDAMRDDAAVAGGDDAAAGADADVDPTPVFDEPFGSIRVIESRASPGGGVPEMAGAVVARFSPEGHHPYHTETMRDGACRMLEYRPGLCPDCDGICVAPDRCVGFPEFLSAGDLTLTGLAIDLTIPFDPDVYPYYWPGPLPAELFTDGAPVEVTSSGADVPGFVASTTAPVELDADLDEPYPLVDGADVTLTWPAPDPASRIRLTIASPNGGHGAPYDAIIECDAPDLGALVIPRAMIEALPLITGMPCIVGNECPPAQLLRYRRAVAPIPPHGDVELMVGSERQFYVMHDPG